MEVGESYSALAGIYRRYELIYVVADERDVLRLRTNYRPGAAGRGEDVYLFAPPRRPRRPASASLNISSRSTRCTTGRVGTTP